MAAHRARGGGAGNNPAYVGVDHCIAVAAQMLAYRLMASVAGRDEVITNSRSFPPQKRSPCWVRRCLCGY